jgi:outer membrane protein
MGIFDGDGLLRMSRAVWMPEDRFRFSEIHISIKRGFFMKGMKTLILATVCFLIPIAAFSASGPDKIGVLDMQKVLDTSSAGKQAQAEIQKKGKEMEAELKKRGTDLEEARKELEREAMVMSKEMRLEKERNFRIAQEDFKILQKQYLEDFRAFEFKLVQRIQKDTLELVDDMGKKEGYVLIVEKREGGVLYFPGSIEVTDKLIQVYNTRFAAAEKAPTAEKPAPKGKKN